MFLEYIMNQMQVSTINSARNSPTPTHHPLLNPRIHTPPLLSLSPKISFILMCITLLLVSTQLKNMIVTHGNLPQF